MDRMADKSGRAVLVRQARLFIVCVFVSLLFFTLLAAFPSAAYANHETCGDDPNTFGTVIRYETNDSFCLLCGLGHIRLRIRNDATGGNADMTDFVIVHNFGFSNMEYVPGSTSVSFAGGGGGNVSGSVEPAISGGGSTLTWNLNATLNQASSHSNESYMYIDFDVRYLGGAANQENLVNANTSMNASVDYTFCPNTTNQSGSAATGNVEIPVREPQPTIIKTGYNWDAGQSQGERTTTVYGHEDDDVIWRIEIRNDGLADMEDVIFSDLMSGSNMNVNYACPSAASAQAIASNDGVGPASGCVGAGNNIVDFVVDDPFGENGVTPEGGNVDVPAGGSTVIYLAGKMKNPCDVADNNAYGVQWGCDVNGNGNDGGITNTSSYNGSQSAGNDTATLSSTVNSNGLNINRQISGTVLSQAPGSKGTVTITITNNTGGTVRNLRLTDVLPTEYVMDPTFDPTVTVTGAYGNYDGMIEGVNWLNPASNTYPYNDGAVTEAQFLSNTAPEFELVTTTNFHSDYPATHVNLLRHGDVAVLRFRIVMVPDAGYEPYDVVANLDVREEIAGDGTDPNAVAALSNQLTVEFEHFCSAGTTSLVYNDNVNSDPEDLDVDITNSGTDLIFILTNDVSTPLPLQVSLTNNGGHTAGNFWTYVSFGATMDVVTAPNGCFEEPNHGNLLEVWDSPADIPANATVYVCPSSGIGTVAPNQTRQLDFEVVKSANAADLTADDLTFRADVVGEVTLSNGIPLRFPAPDTAVINNRANNYSFDGLRARVIGFNLTKDQDGYCTEDNNPLPALPDERVQIGEECTFFIETGGWFGFLTPGFTYIAVQRIDVWDEQPDGQAYVSSTDPDYDASDPANTSDDEIQGISFYPPPAPLDEGGPTLANWFGWRFNQVVPTQRITVKDKWFRVKTTSRILNDPVNTVAPPNEHGAVSSNILNSTFEAVFFNDVTMSEETFSLGQATVGYPREVLRRVDLTIKEPEITVVKEVCNETLNAVGTACGNWTILANDGDTQDSYIYRITLSNTASSGGVERAPAYNITTSDVLDASDMILINDFASDGLDNDGDGQVDDADEGSINDNVVENGVSPVITFSHEHSTGLERLDPGASIVLYYRIDPDDTVAPGQQLVNSVTAAYDSLQGDHGAQTVVTPGNGDIGGAREYTSAAATATVEILPLITYDKRILRLSNTTIGGTPQPVSIGEEVEYELRASIPVANLRQFYIEDNLPTGVSCIEAPVVDLDAPPYSDAGFTPGGQITPVCVANQVVWNFGDQELTSAPVAAARFDFRVSFIARVNNIAANNDTDLISNGDPATSAFLRYVDDAANTVTLNYGQHDLQVREPRINLTKDFETVTTTDAGDILTVTVTATNNGSATAYQLQVLDNLVDSRMTFLNNVSGTDPPDLVDTTTLGVNQPVFSWDPLNPDFAIAPGTTISFTFDVLVDTEAQPQEVLDNTIEARWSSLPSTDTALNAAGSIGVDGNADGMRIGVIPNAGDAVNDYENTATDSVTMGLLTVAKNDLTAADAPEIGAHKHFQIDITLPEGTSHNLVVTDNLAAALQSYVLANNADYDVTYTFTGIVSINGNAPSEAALLAFPADATTGNALWNIGTVVTEVEDDTAGAPAITPMIRIDYYARINNDVNTDAGDTLQNNVSVTYNHGETGATVSISDNTAALTAVEPVLLVNKAVNPAGLVQVGDVLQYTVTVSHDVSSTATAYDVNLSDTLPPQLQLAANSVSAQIGGVAVAGFVSTPLGGPSGTLVWGQGNGDGSLDIPLGQTLVLVYEVTVMSAPASTTLSNNVYVDWTSLNDVVAAYERTGNGCPVTTAPNDYCVGPAVATNDTEDTSGLQKIVIADTYVDASSTATDGIVRIGDIVTYRLSLNLQEGNIPGVYVQDVLPAGLEFVDIVSINGDTVADYDPPVSGAGSNFSYGSITAADLPAAGDTGTLTFTIGDIVNDPAGDASTDTLIIEYRAQVQTGVLPYAANTVLTNTATLVYLDGGVPVVDPARLVSSANVSVWQPLINAITKIDTSGRASIATVNVATDIMYFRVEACNTGTAPAYPVISDDLPPELNETTIAGPNNGAGQPDVLIDGVLTVPAVDYSYTAPAARDGVIVVGMIRPLNPGQCVQLDYNIGFYTDIPANQTWYNSASVINWTLAASGGQSYARVGPVTFGMSNGALVVTPPVKTVVSGNTATIGEEVVYQIMVPGSNTFNGALYDVVISDVLDANLEYLSAVDVSGNNLPISDNSVAPGNISLNLDSIPAGQPAIIEVRARVLNVATANAGVVVNNTADYVYAETDGGASLGGGASANAPFTIVEPLLGLNKVLANITSPNTAPDGGDILRYTISISAAGGAAADIHSDAFDIEVADSLSLGMVYVPGSASVDGSANSIADPVITGDGVNTPQSLQWDTSNTSIDVPEGTMVNISYDVVVLDTVLASQPLSNAAVATWTGIDGDNVYERNGSGVPVENDYISAPVTVSQAVANANAVVKSRLYDSYDAADVNVRIGDIVEFELRLTLQEGTNPGVVITDTLPQGLVFEGTVSINGDTEAPYTALAPMSYNDLVVPTLAGDPATGASTVAWLFGDILNPGDNDPGNNDIIIIYRARVLDNALAQSPMQVLRNTVAFDYLGFGGATLTTGASHDLNVLQPVLTVVKTANPANGDTVIDVDELITYNVTISNSGASPAYDVTLVDTLPVGLRYGTATITMISTTNTGNVLNNIDPVYDPVTGIASWNFNNGDPAYHIPAGGVLTLVYQVQADADLGASLPLVNQAVVPAYYSFDDNEVPVYGGITGVAEIYGPTNTAGVALTSAGPNPLDKENTVVTAEIGVPFSYRIVVPATPMTTALHDVRILDDLSASAADLTYVSVTRITGSQSWTPENTGTATNLVIEDPVNGIDIPAGEQIEIELTVVLTDTPANVGGVVFNNTANYTYNQVNDDAATVAPGLPDTSADMTILAPDNLTLEKTGPPLMRVGEPGTFTLNVHNLGNGTAWDLTVTDLLPNPVPGGMCDQTPPYNVTAQITLADGVTAVGDPLVEGSDFVTNLVSASPVCTYTITMVTPAAGLPADHRLIIGYDTMLDWDSPNNASLSNIAGASQWFSSDTDGTGATGQVRTYTRSLTDGTPGVLDHQDIYTTVTEAVVVSLLKYVSNVTTGEDPGTTATPGDVLRYRIVATNVSAVPVSDFAITDDVDRLNASAVFSAGTLNIISVPPGADVSNTDANGGTFGRGLLDVRGLSMDAMGGANDSITIEFEIALAPAIDSNTVVLNQAQLLLGYVGPRNSDDPNINAADDPAVIGDEDPTAIAITSYPVFEVQKISTDLTGLPNELMAGDTLRYTITVRNHGTENAVNTLLRDQVPANTSYVPDSTTLNGVTVPDPVAGVTPLQDGMLINAPLDATPGYVPADTTGAANTMVTVTFDVVINSDVVNGTIISNQGYVNGEGAGSGPIPAEQPSDDPDTALPDDPTLDVVGNLPLVDALKTVVLYVDNGTPGVVDPGDVLRYTITMTNYGAVPATGVVLSDAVPANTTYVADSVYLNGEPVAQPDNGVSPLVAGIDISSDDLTPPLPDAGVGYLSPRSSAVVTFDVMVNAAVATGTVISNQGFVSNNELPVEPTDADGNDANGDQPTLIVVGPAQQLAITKAVNVVGGGAATAGGQLEYLVTVTNIGLVPADYVVITDNLDLPVAGQMTLVGGSATLNGLATGVSYVAPVLTADYSSNYGALAPGQSATLRFVVQLDPGLALGTTVTNTAQVQWDLPPKTAEASVSIDIGGTPGFANLNGRVWHDSDFDDAYNDGIERPLENWAVNIVFKNKVLDTVYTDANGEYHINGLAANYLGPDRYSLYFVAPGAGPNTAKLGMAVSPFGNGQQFIIDIITYSGNNLQDLNLPIDPNGVVYNSVTRVPVAGATLTLLNAATGAAVSANCFDDPVQQGQITLSEGFYKFDLNFSEPDCPNGGDYLLQLTAPADGYVNRVSMAIPPQSDVTTAAFSVPACLGSAVDAVPATLAHCEVQSFAGAPALSIFPGAAGTEYHLHLSLDNNTVPGESQLFNNHLPIDPELDELLTVSKISPKLNVVRGELVPYTITVTNTLPIPLTDITVFDFMPAGFKYVPGSARLNGVSAEPQRQGLTLSWMLPQLDVEATSTIELLLIAGAGVREGEYTNRAQLYSALTDTSSGVAQATVRVVPDPGFDCSDIVGKVFDDSNLNGRQDAGERGLGGVRLATVRGLLITTDAYGRFHLSCAATPDESRGGNFILKLDERTLPTGYRLTSENPRVQRLTRGKSMSFNFGATIHRTVSMDVAAGVFERGGSAVRAQWLPRIGQLIGQLRKQPAVLRLQYLADVEDASLVNDRLEELKDLILEHWEKVNGYKLVIETQIFWRHGGPGRGGFD